MPPHQPHLHLFPLSFSRLRSLSLPRVQVQLRQRRRRTTSSENTRPKKWLRGSRNLRTQVSQPWGGSDCELSSARPREAVRPSSTAQPPSVVLLDREGTSWHSQTLVKLNQWVVARDSPENWQEQEEHTARGFNCSFLSPRSSYGLKIVTYQLVSPRSLISIYIYMYYLCLIPFAKKEHFSR